MPESPNAEAIAKHARALERLRIVHEAIADTIADLPAETPEAISLRLQRTAERLDSAIADLE